MAAGGAVRIACRNVRFLANPLGSNADLVFQPSPYGISVEESPRGRYGYVAHISSAPNHQTDDFDVLVYTDEAALGRDPHWRRLAERLLPNLVWSEVSIVRVANVGVRANLQDSAGSMIVEFLRADQSLLGRIIQVGLGYGLCR